MKTSVRKKEKDLIHFKVMKIKKEDVSGIAFLIQFSLINKLINKLAAIDIFISDDLSIPNKSVTEKWHDF